MSHPAAKSSLSPQLAATTILDWLKPPRGEALARLRTNGLGLLTLTVLTNLLPLPSPWVAIATVRKNLPVSTFYYGLCALEVLVLAILGLNILQASYALKYPRAQAAPPPPPPSPKANHASPRKWHLSNLSPNPSPQRQKSFNYAPSPASTPSRTLNYTIPPSAALGYDTSFTSSIGSVPGSPASPLAGYRGRHSVASGRAFDGSLLVRLAHENSDEDEDE
ncbi:uncharacterized protein C8Q71DRAFT_460234 [Rhodofomes roseus]|uniref:Uncharacterized protein n=1 Tax=Rhodofomes roseus TaxID=34475 RepID=A0ABQ8KMV5_9APHY|nr:uncharacterized protein C8Q71DRAFT_460234 [Rhodofomes roseus]KAH9839715.1 hypothetical protein C8Q71DRAFT_460234 [Rhodofomes roseus]